MKYHYIKLHNFMRYIGDNDVEFSCDNKDNVTVVLGDNTHGKTTLAQAFRWCLYGELALNKYLPSASDAVILNKDIIAKMAVGEKQDVCVSVKVEDKGTSYIFTRKHTYVKKFDSEEGGISLCDTDLNMQKETGGIKSDVNGQKEFVQEQIETMFPKSLSNYFFFDGERWQADRNKKEDIKKSINAIIGWTPYLDMARHLKDQGAGSAISMLNKKVQSSSDIVNGLQADIDKLEKEVEDLTAENEKLDSSITSYTAQIERYEQTLTANKDAEEAKKKLDDMQFKINQIKNKMEDDYLNVVEDFSSYSTIRFIGGSMLGNLSSLLEGVDLEGKNIPGVTVSTVDFLINDLHKCLCGACLDENDPEYDSKAKTNLLDLRRVIPPVFLGTAAGGLKNRVASWKEETLGYMEKLERNVKSYHDNLKVVDDLIGKRDSFASRIDNSLNLGAVRNDYNKAKEKLADAQSKLLENKGVIKEKNSSIESKTEQIKEICKKNSDNDKIYLAIAYAEKAYKRVKDAITKREGTLVDKLNEIINRNFGLMFNEKEKYPKLENDYKIHMYYRSSNEEELVLSPGETAAINFTFIISIIELAKLEQEEIPDTDKDTTIQLPLVLDAPFSNLSGTNIGLIAGNLTKQAEQIIVFMLDKDWPASGLKAYTGDKYCYRIKKQVNENFSKIERTEGM